MLLYQDYIPADQQAFADKVSQIAYNLNLNPDWLMFVMYSESRLNPSAQNPNSTATGLIQFLDSTAQSLGTTTAAIAQMSGLQQLDLVQQYYSDVISRYGQINDIGDAYLAVFYPAAIGWPLTKAFPDSVYQENKIFDVNGDGVITKGEFLQWIQDQLPPDYSYLITETHKVMNKIAFIIGLLLIVCGAYLAWTFKK